MFTRFFDALRGRPNTRRTRLPFAAADVSSGMPPTAIRPSAMRDPITRTPGAIEPPVPAAGSGCVSHDPILPHPAVMIEQWRQDVARAAILLRDRYAAITDPQVRTHAERLLLRLSLDHAMVVRQPPAAAHDALAVAGNPECEIPHLVQIIERDPTLTRGLMRHASSAMFAAAGAPASINDATRRLGAKGVQIAVLAGMAEGLMARGDGPYSPLAEQAWATMVRVGPLARALARALGGPAPEAFLLGLLHDIGTLVLYDLLDTLRTEIGHGAELPAAFVADAVCELHEPLGGLTLLRWGIDPRAAWAVAHHHRRQPPADPDRRSELIFLAQHLDAALVAGETPPVEHWFTEGQLIVSRERVAAAVTRVCATQTVVR